MTIRSPGAAVVSIVLLSTTGFLALPVWGWGNFGGFVDHPARVGACLVVALASIAMLFSGANMGGRWDADPRTTLIVVPVMAVSLLMAWLPAYADRREIAIVDGDITRYVGLALFVLGCILRVGPMFDLGGRFRPPWMKQEEHRLVTTGFYQHVRNPSYLGALIAMIGWFLVFRCWLGCLLVVLLIPLVARLLRTEEAMLLEEFGEEYVAYKKRTGRFIPFVN
jgi:protein-S-isoprenylcysteine O-methyltransferase Ste14